MEKKHKRPTTLIRLLLILSGIGALFEANTHNITLPKYIQLEAYRFAIQVSEAIGCLFLFAGIVLLLVHTFYPEKKLWPTVGYGLMAFRLIPMVFRAIQDVYLYKTAFCTPDTASDVRLVLALLFEGSLVFLAVFLVIAAYRQRAYPVPVIVIGGLWGLYDLIGLGYTIYTDIRWTHLLRHWQDWVICAAHLCLLASVILLQQRQKAALMSE